MPSAQMMLKLWKWYQNRLSSIHSKPRSSASTSSGASTTLPSILVSFPARLRPDPDRSEPAPICAKDDTVLITGQRLSRKSKRTKADCSKSLSAGDKVTKKLSCRS
ncbi:hypothetical protein TB2_029294 [Malus domestica]